MKKEIDKKELGINRYIGIKISEARMAAGLTAQDLGLKIGVSPQQIGHYESGADKISIAKLFLVSEALSLNLKYFLGDIKPAEWDKTISESQVASLNLSNNFRKIKDTECKKAISSLLVAITRLDSSININNSKA